MTSGAQDAVERMIARGASFDEIEHYIEQLALPSPHLSALWLLAWAEATDPITRRQIVATTLAELDDLPAASYVAAPGPSLPSHARADELIAGRRAPARRTRAHRGRRGQD